jgi:N-acetylglucosamine kinase-like BadF-type ATPase
MSEAGGKPLVLGVDGGGTSTVSWLADADGRILGRGGAGASNAKAVGDPEAREALEKSRRLAFADAGLGVRRIEVACLGLAGFDRPDDRAKLEGWVADWTNRLILCNDAELLLAAGTPAAWGIALIAGTGSICYGRSADGTSARSGGWGPTIGDEGSAYRVVLEALRLVAWRADGRAAEIAPDPLTRAACALFGVDRPESIVTAIYDGTWDRARLAAQAPKVSEAAFMGDPGARDLLAQAGEELAAMVLAVCRALGWTPASAPRPLPLALGGGFLLAAGVVRSGVLQALREHGFDVSARDVAEPVSGAIVLARRALGS